MKRQYERVDRHLKLYEMVVLILRFQECFHLKKRIKMNIFVVTFKEDLVHNNNNNKEKTF